MEIYCITKAEKVAACLQSLNKVVVFFLFFLVFPEVHLMESKQAIRLNELSTGWSFYSAVTPIVLLTSLSYCREGENACSTSDWSFCTCESLSAVMDNLKTTPTPRTHPHPNQKKSLYPRHTFASVHNLIQ